jgi:hypothetical protein
VALLACLISACARCEEDPQKALEARIAADRNTAAHNAAVNNARTPEEAKAAMDKQRKARNDAQKKQDLAEYKEKVLGNLAAVKELFAKAEESWKNQKYAEAGQLYNSVAMATVAGSEEMVETSRGRMVEMEDLAKGHLKAADDNDIKRDYLKELDELSLVVKEFGLTKTHDTAQRRLITLKSHPEVAGYVELSAAESLETDGKLMDALNIYKSVAANPRYENTVPALKARRKLEELDKNEATRSKIKTETDAKADKEAPLLLASAKNFLLNNKPKEAIAKLQTVVEKFPDSKYAEEAKKQLAGLK